MKNDQAKLVSPLAQVICALVSVVFALYMGSKLPQFIPVWDIPALATALQVLGAIMFGALFWLASMCFTVVLVDMRRRRSEMPGLSD